MIHYPAVVIRANEDVKAVRRRSSAEPSFARYRQGPTNTEAAQSSFVRKVRKNIGTAFYRAYLTGCLRSFPICWTGSKTTTCPKRPTFWPLPPKLCIGF